MQLLRCGGCLRVLGVAARPDRRLMFCPDRTCYLYPPVTALKSKTKDVTLSSWVLALRLMHRVPHFVLSKAMGKSRTWSQEITDRQKIHWSKFK